MWHVVLIAFIASVALPIGAMIGVWARPSQGMTAALMGFASGALIVAVSFELFAEAFESHGLRASLAFAAGAIVFIVADEALERRTEHGDVLKRNVGFAILLGVTLDGIPENLAMGVSLVEGTSIALLAAIFMSNLPEAIVGAKGMRESDMTINAVIATWAGVGVLLMVPTVVGYSLVDSFDESAMAVPLGFAAGAVLASLADTLMPEAYKEGGPYVALATGAGFLFSYVLTTL